MNFKNISDPNIMYKTVSTLGIELRKQKILETLNVQKLEMVISHLDNELELMSVEKELEVELKLNGKNSKRVLFK